MRGLPVGCWNPLYPMLNRWYTSSSIRPRRASMSAGVWQLRADLGDGIPHTVRITLR